jgi:glutaminyl-tRNA synthetase
VAKRENLIDVGLLEFCVREDLNNIALRRMVVFDPLKVVITNFEKGREEILESEDNPEAETVTKRNIPFARELYIEQEDFMENPPKKYFRLAPGQMVRLKSAYIIRCDNVVKGSDGKVTEIECTYIPESRSGSDTSGINVKGTLHWVSILHAVKIEARMYDRLFKVEDLTQAEGDFKDHLNADSLQVLDAVYAEPAIASATEEERYQFLRKGYFCLDPDSSKDRLVFNRTVTLRDMWAKK